MIERIRQAKHTHITHKHGFQLHTQADRNLLCTIAFDDEIIQAISLNDSQAMVLHHTSPTRCNIHIGTRDSMLDELYSFYGFEPSYSLDGLQEISPSLEESSEWDIPTKGYGLVVGVADGVLNIGQDQEGTWRVTLHM